MVLKLAKVVIILMFNVTMVDIVKKLIILEGILVFVSLDLAEVIAKKLELLVIQELVELDNASVLQMGLNVNVLLAFKVYFATRPYRLKSLTLKRNPIWPFLNQHTS